MRNTIGVAALLIALVTGCQPEDGGDPGRAGDEPAPADSGLSEAWTCSGTIAFSKGRYVVTHEARPTAGGGVVATCSIALPEGTATGVITYAPGQAFAASARCTVAADANKPSAPGTLTLSVDTSLAQSSVFYAYSGKTVTEGLLSCEHHPASN